MVGVPLRTALYGSCGSVLLTDSHDSRVKLVELCLLEDGNVFLPLNLLACLFPCFKDDRTFQTVGTILVLEANRFIHTYC